MLNDFGVEDRRVVIKREDGRLDGREGIVYTRYMNGQVKQSKRRKNGPHSCSSNVHGIYLCFSCKVYLDSAISSILFPY